MEYAAVSGGPLEVNTYVVYRPEEPECLLIDPGAEPEQVRRAVGSRKVSAVLLTHAHFDHILYASHWLKDGVRLYLHEADLPMLSDPHLNMSVLIGHSLTLRKPDVLLHEGDVVSEAGLSLQVLHTPGHTRGSVCFLNENVLFSGDTLFYASRGRTDLPGGDEKEMRASLKRLLQMPSEWLVLPGHGSKTSIGIERMMQG